MPEAGHTHGRRSAGGNGGGNGNGTAHGSAEPNGNGMAARRPASLTLVPKAPEKLSTRDFKSDQEVRWCPGCGDYAILAAFQAFLPELEVPRENVVVISGIGCSSRLPYYMDSYGMHSIHGRAPAIATGLAASRPDLSVWVVTGDGDALSIGGNHLIHALRRNVNIKILLFNNRIYGLTKGQYSPTSEQGKITKSTPFGSLDTPFNPVSLALGAEASFVARTIDSDRKHLTSVLRAAADHRGAAFIEIYQNCPIFNDEAFSPLTDASSRDDQLIRLEHGEPIRFGASKQRGLRFGRYGGLEAVDVAEADGGSLLTHDAHTDDPSYAFALSRLDTVNFAHSPIGVFRQVERPSYDALMAQQISQARTKQGDGDLATLLSGGDTWTIG
ncbi:MAG TPA: 2-oxoacid:ferredoxin oxidoreductase subunit beta [Streptosporangiaceae bacterium]|jgi:2-oxoglutarate ferredoxin oxidoreductase subunit beta|nr:2-oxoacid:ferredoxin oxidoreductase subunit beta [Streptosporangiaceae bacterium]